jgi:hypothetical protein
MLIYARSVLGSPGSGILDFMNDGTGGKSFNDGANDHLAAPTQYFF